MAKRVRDAEGGVSQCGEQRSTKRSEARSSPTRRETPQKNNVLLSGYLIKTEHYQIEAISYFEESSK